jgi:L-cystine uptake protein TcyP (sodium:dicarboxylate symporter family)
MFVFNFILHSYIMLQTIVFVILSTLVLSIVKNKSNFSEYLMIPLIVSLLTKYALGDWDKGYQWSINDLYYWVSLVSVSLITLFIHKHYFRY